MASNRASGTIGNRFGKAASREQSPGWTKIFANPLKRPPPETPPTSFAPNALSDDSINAIIEGEIIPRLLMAHAIGKPADSAQESFAINPSDVHKFGSLPLKLEAANLLEEVDNFLDQGVSVEAIFIDLLAPAARQLGEMWSNDECDFVDVTMGVWRLQEVMRDIAHRVPAPTPKDIENQPRILISPMPGDQHNFGALMLDEIFSREGWSTMALTKPARRELLDLLAVKPFDVVALTMSRDCPSSALANLIETMRSVSTNPHISVLIGGQAINRDPSIATEVGADGTGTDARAALEVANRLVQSAPLRAHSMR